MSGDAWEMSLPPVSVHCGCQAAEEEQDPGKAKWAGSIRGDRTERGLAASRTGLCEQGGKVPRTGLAQVEEGEGAL